ncbi:MAG: GTPase HflX, partial [Pseudomonadota bacterium]
EAAEAELVIINGPITPKQQQNLEKAWHVKVLDRTGLILEIFGDRAQTREGVLQVDLAHLTYQKSRLVRSWTHLERQRGGLGFIGGPGETQIEADRRALSEQITRIRRQLSKVVKTRKLHRKARAKVPFPIVALVGYTNAGKSTIFNRLSGADVMAKDMLFATLDPRMRRVALPGGTDVIVSDTVGFISDLPTQLVAAFRATLEEVTDADLILHVRDISHPETEIQAEAVHGILDDLGVRAGDSVPMIEVQNKIDCVPADEADVLIGSARTRADRVVLSAATGAGFETLTAAIEAALAPPVEAFELTLGFDEGRDRAWLFRHNLVRGEEATDEGYRLAIAWTAKDRARWEELRRSGQD